MHTARHDPFFLAPVVVVAYHETGDQHTLATAAATAATTTTAAAAAAAAAAAIAPASPASSAPVVGSIMVGTICR